MPEPNHTEVIARQLLEESMVGDREVALRCDGFSMEPMISSGDEVYFKKSNALCFGDIVVYKKNGNYIVHRFMGKRIADTQAIYFLKGDNVAHFDEPVSHAQVLGKVTKLRKNGRIINLETLAGRCVSLSYFAYAHVARLVRPAHNKTKAALVDERRLLKLIASGISGEEEAQGFVALLSATLNWDYLFERIKWNFISPLFVSKVKQMGVTEKVPLDILNEFENINRLQLVLDTRKRHLLVEVLNAFNASGIRALLSKGIHLGSEVYEDSYQRWMGDIDIMVEPKDWMRARKTLGDIGFSGLQEPYPGCDEWGIRYLDSHNDFHKNGLRVELKSNNWALEFPYFEYSLWEGARPYRLAGEACYVPSREDALLIACLNLARHNFEGLIWFIDIKKLTETYVNSIDWQKIVGTARRYDIDTIVYYALSLTDQLCGMAQASRAYEALKPGWVKRTLFQFFWDKETILLRKEGRASKAKIPFECVLILFGGKFSFYPRKLTRYLNYLFKVIFAPPGYLKEKHGEGLGTCVCMAYLLRIRKFFFALLQAAGNLVLKRH